MKNIKNVVKKICLFGLLSVVFAVNIFSMRMTPKQVERGKAAVQQVMHKEERKNQYFIYEDDNKEKNGIWVDKQFVKDNCKSIKNMVEDFGEELNAIPLSFSVEIIKLGFDLLRDKKDVKYLSDVNHLSFKEWVDVANLFNFLDVPADKMQAVLMRIKEIIDSNPNNIVGNETLKKLNPDLQKLIMIEPVINCLKNCIVQKYAKDRRKSLIGHPNRVYTVAFSPDGTKIISGCWSNQNNLILWDITDPNAITYKPLVGHPDAVYTVAFSPDGKKIISGCGGDQNNLILWDITDPNAITYKPLVGHPDDVYTVAFSPDGTKIIAGCSGGQNNLILWDITDSNAITYKPLVGHPQDVRTVAFSPDGTKIISGCSGDRKKNLILWDITDSNAITHKPLVGHPQDVKTVAFSPDGTKIISGCRSVHKNLILWDITDSNAITYKPLVGHPEDVKTVAFSPDGTKIISGCSGGQNNFILWDITNLNAITYKPLVGHPQDVRTVAFSPDGTKIISGCRGDQNNLILWDIIDPSAITHNTFVGHSKIVVAVAFSPDGKKIISGDWSDQNNLILWPLLTDQEEALLNQIKNYNVDQIRLIYQLCLQSSKKQKIELKKGSEEDQILKTLPEDMHKLLTDLFVSKGWLSGWWS